MNLSEYKAVMDRLEAVEAQLMAVHARIDRVLAAMTQHDGRLEAPMPKGMPRK